MPGTTDPREGGGSGGRRVLALRGGGLLTLPVLALAALPAMAADAPATIVVTGHALQSPGGAAAYGTLVIDRRRIEEEASGRLENLLRDVAGFQQFRRSDSRAANPTSQGATLRSLGGNASSRALVLLDGVPQLDPFAGWVAWPSLDPERLASVRVTRGGGAGAFGPGAVAGAIELFSAAPGELSPVSAEVALGSRASLAASAGLALPVGAGFITASVRRDRGDGYHLVPEEQRGRVDVPARYGSWSVAIRGVAPVGGGTELQARAAAFDDDRRRGLAGAESNSRGVDASLRLVGRGDWSWEALAYVQARRFASRALSVTSDRQSVAPALDQFATPSTGLGGKAEVRPPLGPDHVLQIGADLRSAVGRTRELFRFRGGGFTGLREAGGRSQTTGVYVEDSWSVAGRLTLAGGARIDRWEIRNGFLDEFERATGAATLALPFEGRSGWRPSARAGAVLGAGGGVRLRAAAYTGFRMPTLNELYRPFRAGADATAANAALGLERLRGAEAGLDWNPLASIRLALTGYWNELEGAISNVTLARGPGIFPQVGVIGPGGAFRQRQNVGAIRVRGVEVSAALRYGDWSASTSYAFADARVHAGGTAAALNGMRPAQSPEHQASVTLGWAPEAMSISMTARYVGAQFEDDFGERRLPEASTLDGAVAVRVAPWIEAEARAENLLGERVVAGISGDGLIDLGTPRTLSLGLRFANRRR